MVNYLLQELHRSIHNLDNIRIGIQMYQIKVSLKAKPVSLYTAILLRSKVSRDAMVVRGLYPYVNE